MDQSFRGILQRLEQEGDLHIVTRTVDPRFELGTVMGLRQHDLPQLFSKVAGHGMPGVGNLMNTRERAAGLLGTERGALPERIRAALAVQIPPVLVEAALWEEVVHGEPVARDSEPGRRNAAIACRRLVEHRSSACFIPLFGAALLGLAGVGYAAKRKTVSAASEDVKEAPRVTMSDGGIAPFRIGPAILRSSNSSMRI